MAVFFTNDTLIVARLHHYRVQGHYRVQRPSELTDSSCSSTWKCQPEEAKRLELVFEAS
jgi:hypothetical protein